MEPDSLVDMVIKNSHALSSCMRDTSGFILVEGHDGSFLE